MHKHVLYDLSMSVVKSIAKIQQAVSIIGAAELARRAGVDRRVVSALIGKPPKYMIALMRIEAEALKEIENGDQSNIKNT